MDASDLRVFHAVARLGSIGKAALELHTVQSNVTARIKALEEDLGAKLFERHPRGVTLTSAGKRLLPFADKAGALFAQARRAVADDGDPAGPLCVGSLETTAALRLPPLLSRFAGAHPRVDLTLVTGTSDSLIRDVLEHRLEGAFVVGPVSHPELDEEIVYREELVLVTAPGVRSIEQLRQAANLKIIVFRSGCTYRHRLEAFLAARGLVGIRQLEFGTLGGIVGCVSAGIGVTLLPRAVIAAELRDGLVAAHDLPAGEARADTVFVRRSDALASSAMTAFVEAARPVPIRLVRQSD